MELKKAGEWLKGALKKENARRLVIVLGLCGIALLGLSSLDFKSPEPQKEAQQEEDAAAAYARQLEQDLARIVTAITGEKDPAVMVTLENNGRQLYAQDKKEGGDEKESAHVVLEDREGAQRALEITQARPKIQGVVIVSREAADPAAREKLINAAKTALGVPSSRVCVTGGRTAQNHK